MKQVELGRVPRAAVLHAPGRGDDRGEGRPVEEEVVLERRRHRLLDPLDPVAERLEQLRGLAGELVDLGRGADVDALGHHRHGPARAARTSYVADRRQAQVAVDPLGLAEERRRVADRAGQHAVGDDPDRHLAQRLVLREPAAGRLQPDQAVDGGGDPDRAAAVVAVGERDGAGGDQGSGAGRGGTGRVVGRPGRADRAEPRVLRRGAEPVLGELGLADRDEPGGEEHPGEVAVALGRPGVERVGALHRGHAGEVDVVLEEGRDAGEEAAPRVGGLGAGAVEALDRDGVEGRPHPLGPRDRRLDHLGDRDPARGERLGEPDRVEVAEGVVGEGVEASHDREASRCREAAAAVRSRPTW